MCGFPLNMESDGWFDFVIKCKHLFLSNIYYFDELQQIEILYRLLEFYPLFETVLDDGHVSDEVRNFLVEDLSDCYETFNELRNDIQHVSV